MCKVASAARTYVHYIRAANGKSAAGTVGACCDVACATPVSVSISQAICMQHLLHNQANAVIACSLVLLLRDDVNHLVILKTAA